MPVSPWRTRGVAASVVASALSTVAVVLLARTLPQRVPTHTGHRGTVDAWSSPTGWAWTTVPVVTIIPLASLAFVILVSNLREGFHLRDKHAQAYWTEESHWPEARRRLADTSGWFFAAFSSSWWPSCTSAPAPSNGPCRAIPSWCCPWPAFSR